MSTVSVPPHSIKVSVTCGECGSVFMRYPSDIKTGRQFCSQKCKIASAYVSLTCARCSTSFRRRRSKVKTVDNNYCSRACKGSSAEVQCKNCGCVFNLGLAQVKPGGNFCSRECHYMAHGRGVIDNGDGTATLELTRGYVAIIDQADIPLVSGLSWQAQVQKGHVYAKARINGKETLLHCLLIPGEGIIRDHIDGDGLNNRRSNLRIATHAQNLMNSGPSSRSTTGVKGVQRLPNGKYEARLGGSVLGRFSTISEAARSYNEAAFHAYGEFAYLNPIPEEAA